MKQLPEIGEVSFRPLSFSDILLVHRWFNLPHVQEFYSLCQWTEKEVLNKLRPNITGEKSISTFIIVFDKFDIGYVQFYKVKDYPWPDQDLAEDIIFHAAGMDMFIGEINYIGKGIGSRIIAEFLNKIIWPNFNYCIVDPDVKNKAAIRCYEKLKFKEHKIIQTTDALGRATELKLMLLKKPG